MVFRRTSVRHRNVREYQAQRFWLALAALALTLLFGLQSSRSVAFTLKSSICYNVHCPNKRNAGDWNCVPTLYWDNLLKYIKRQGPRPASETYCICAVVDPPGRELPFPDSANVIIGGGGLLQHKSFVRGMTLFAKRGMKGSPTAFWGLGLNGYTDDDIYERYPLLPSYLTSALQASDNKILIGIRDWDESGKLRWVPCASCLHSAFDEALQNATTAERTSAEDDNDDTALAAPKLRIGILTSTVPEGNAVADHIEEWTKQGLIGEDNLFSNDGDDMQPIIEFLNAHDVIVTSSYHACYWGSLLGKKIVLVDVWSSKFKFMKHPPAVFKGNQTEGLMDAIERAETYPNALEECRQANYVFFKDVLDLFYGPGWRFEKPGTYAR